MPDQNSIENVERGAAQWPRKMTDEEARAVLTLVKGGWLHLSLDLGGEPA